MTLADQWADLEAIEGRTHVVEVLIDLIVVHVNCLELSEVSDLQLLEIQFLRFKGQVVKVALIWKAGETDLVQSVRV